MGNDNYLKRSHLKKFGEIVDFQEPLGNKFFDYYHAVFEDGALSKREKALIALAVAHAQQCPYCIDAYTNACLQEGADEAQMMEAVHVAAAMKAGITLVFSVQMMEDVKKKTM